MLLSCVTRGHLSNAINLLAIKALIDSHGTSLFANVLAKAPTASKVDDLAFRSAAKSQPTDLPPND